jgi:carotenoid cleavage dioxygenase-like enzyme
LALGADADGGTSLYVLDARGFALLARCRSPVALPAGFHGAWFPKPKVHGEATITGVALS